MRMDRPGLTSGGSSDVSLAQHQAYSIAAALWEHKALAASEMEQLHCQLEKCLGDHLSVFKGIARKNE